MQYVNDSLLFGGICQQNLWVIKAILHSFKLVSGLRINFSKSKLYGINAPMNFWEGATTFLHYFVETIPFKFLELPIGINHRREIAWELIVKLFQKTLSSQKGRFLSMGGRIMLSHGKHTKSYKQLNGKFKYHFPIDLCNVSNFHVNINLG